MRVGTIVVINDRVSSKPYPMVRSSLRRTDGQYLSLQASNSGNGLLDYSRVEQARFEARSAMARSWSFQ